MPPGLPSHDTKSMPASVPPAAQGLSGALWIEVMADQVCPLSLDNIIRIAPEVPTGIMYCWQTAYIVPPPSMATAGSPTKFDTLGMETFLLQVRPPSVVNEYAQTRFERSSIQPASARPFGPVARATSVCLPVPVSSLRRTFLL